VDVYHKSDVATYFGNDEDFDVAELFDTGKVW